jgi:hypothetical protein
LTRRCVGDAGVVGGVEVLPFGFLVFLVGSLLAASAWAVVDVKLAVTSASREAVRRYVEAPDHATAVRLAETSARQTVREHGRDASRTGVRIEHVGGHGWARCTRVVITVTHPVPLLSLPWIGGFGRSFDAVSSHSEIIDPFRAGVTGDATC